MAGLLRRPLIRCPICLSRLDWNRLRTVRSLPDGQLVPYTGGLDQDPLQLREDRINVYRECPGTAAGPEDDHLLPYGLADYGAPLAIGIVGAGSAGKSCLLAAMIASLINAADLGRVPLRIDPLDFQLHDRYEREVMRPFLQERRKLNVTRFESVQFTDALRIHNTETNRSHAVTFFDVGGERLQNAHDNLFLSGLGALIFVVDADQIVRRHRLNGPPVLGDPVFSKVMERLGAVHGYTTGGFLPLPAAVVVAKSDVLRFLNEPAVDHWFAQDSGDDVDFASVERESGDVYRLLHRRGPAYLSPASKCLRSTLHFTSAAGLPAGPDGFPETGFGPRRVLKPLLSLLRAKNILTSKGERG
jgi:hypothetical protein